MSKPKPTRRELIEFILEVANYARKERADVYVGLPEMVDQWESICRKAKKLSRVLKGGGR